jgi:hypothetical protein
MRQMATKTWCVEWSGSEGDFLAGGKRQPIPLARLSGLENLYAIGALEQRPGEVSIFDSVPFVSDVWNPTETEQQLENQLVAWAVTSGIDVDQPFAFLLNGLVAQATFHVLCNRGRGRYNAELHEKSKVRFPIANESVEVVGFYSRHHRGIFTPRDSNFHMHVRTLDNRFSGHLEMFNWEHGIMLYLPIDDSRST